MSDFTEIGKAAAKVFEDGIRAMIAQELDARGVKGPSTVVNNNVTTYSLPDSQDAQYIEVKRQVGGGIVARGA
ncbi:hypothetical protein PBI_BUZZLYSEYEAR_103 [Mycobacterium phage BuzzLyseyear]|uniref:Uncharacterized protein n=1 Tax=Mycobacterium phage BuzzLyseyear TaxID=1536598 RepID=A0A088FPR9_9CAUD|nr:hypothetical protein PBI_BUZZLYSEYEAR_103 [Mycobacterium phage BuzzLyseyear]AIM50225.1 hypothetical protein PBI_BUZZLYSEYEAR_103 [Mycobacterium phage BuzzLyseyear]